MSSSVENSANQDKTHYNNQMTTPAENSTTQLEHHSHRGERLAPRPQISPREMERMVESIGAAQSVEERLCRVQTVICALQYNHTGMEFFRVDKRRAYRALMETARQILAEALPIKCLEAVVLGAYLTNGWLTGSRTQSTLHLPASASTVDRFPLVFESCCQGNTYKHIILVVHYLKKPAQAEHVESTSSSISISSLHRYGALGLSRRTDLMYRPPSFSSLSALVDSFLRAYAGHLHSVVRVHIGLPFPQSPSSTQTVLWNVFQIALPPLTTPLHRQIQHSTHTNQLRFTDSKSISNSKTSSAPVEEMLSKLDRFVREMWANSEGVRSLAAAWQQRLVTLPLKNLPTNTNTNTQNGHVKFDDTDEYSDEDSHSPSHSQSLYLHRTHSFKARKPSAHEQFADEHRPEPQDLHVHNPYRAAGASVGSGGHAQSQTVLPAVIKITQRAQQSSGSLQKALP